MYVCVCECVCVSVPVVCVRLNSVLCLSLEFDGGIFMAEVLARTVCSYMDLEKVR